MVNIKEMSLNELLKPVSAGPVGTSLAGHVHTFAMDGGPTGAIIVNADGLGTMAWSASLPSGLQSSSILYDTPGTFTWSLPASAQTIIVTCCGGGGGGGGGARDATTIFRSGGAGGGGGGVSLRTFSAMDLTPTVSYTVGAGGTGGASQGTDAKVGNPGIAGGNSYFGATGAIFILGGGGGAGSGGQINANTNAGGAGGGGIFVGGAGGSVSTTNAGPFPGLAGAYTAGGGSAGGGQANVTTAVSGANGISASPFSFITAPAGGVSGASGTNGASLGPVVVDSTLFGSGAGGGGYITASVTGSGGNGGPGSGGGGGASADNTNASGAGGNGGNGWILIQVSF